jgi:hypothetical protein
MRLSCFCGRQRPESWPISKPPRHKWNAPYDATDGYEMPGGSYSLGEAAAKLNMIRLTCPKCHRTGQYHVDKLLERYGPDMAIMSLRSALAGAT